MRPLLTAVLNIGRMAPGSHDYYLRAVADGTEDYYLREGEAPGRWLGRGLSRVGLEGRVEADQLRAVLAGDHPGTGERLAKHPARKVPGFDLTFRAPKSVSLLWGLGDPGVAAQVQAAHDAAVDAAIGFLEREAARTRRGAGGTERVEVEGLIAAAFPHRTSRANDPLLHTHVLLANLARTVDDGVWRTLESRRLFLYAKTAGFLYQAQLRHELTTRLGVKWGPVVNGHADLDRIPRQLIEEFSRRRRQILQRLEERGESSAKAAQVATLETRDAKDGRHSEADLRGFWARRAREHGFDPDRLDELLHRGIPRAPDVAALVLELVEGEALTEKSSTFARRDVLLAVAERLPDGAPVETVEELANQVLERGRDELVVLGSRRGRLAAVNTIRCGDGRIVAADAGEARLTTRGLLLLEQHAVNVALARRDEGVAVVDEGVLDRILATRSSLSDEQVAMVRGLTREGDGVAVVVGKAGTGKTFALDAARDAWMRAGIQVRGVALAARAARELEASAGIASTTIHAFLAAAQDPECGSPLAPGSVLVVDEAAMVDTRTLARLLDHADRHHLKVVLVGDPRQLPEIDAGGLFSLLAQRLAGIELSDNRRQTEPWEIAALDQLRHGDPSAALHAYQQHGRIVTGESAEAVREALVSDWWHAHDAVGASEAVMVALRKCDVDDLNHRARTRLAAAGLLTGPPLTIDDEAEFRVGDRVVCLRNHRRLGVVNGTFATVTAIDAANSAVTIATDAGASRALPGWYVAQHLAHGYAITGHKAQGLTCQHTFVLGSGELYREWGYVALSRGRSSNRLYIHEATVDLDAVGHARPADPDPLGQLATGMGRSRAHAAASVFDPADDGAAELAARWRQLRRTVDASGMERRVELAARRGSLAQQHEHLTATVQRLQRERDDAAAGLGRLRRARRDQIAHLDHQLANRSDTWQHITDQLEAVDAELARLPSQQALRPLLEQLDATGEQLEQHAARRVQHVEAHTPDYLLTTIGAPPPEAAQRERWRAAARAVESYRVRWDITDPHQPFGTHDTHDTEQLAVEDRREATRALLDAIRTPHHDRDRDRGPVLYRGLSR